jgi:hypothetical protein
MGGTKTNRKSCHLLEKWGLNDCYLKNELSSEQRERFGAGIHIA